MEPWDVWSAEFMKPTAFEPKAMEALLSRVERNDHISSKLMSNEGMRAVVLTWMRQQVFEASKTG